MLAAPGSNLRLSLRLPDDRWLLYAFAFRRRADHTLLGRAAAISARRVIGRTTLTPLAARDWLLLGLGLSTFSWLVLGLFVVFVAVFAWRARHAAPADSQRFRLLQVGSGILAIIAIVAVISAVPQGLLAHPDMRIAPEASPGSSRGSSIGQPLNCPPLRCCPFRCGGTRSQCSPGLCGCPSR